MDFEIEEEILGNFALYPELMDKFVCPEQAFLDPTNNFIYKLFRLQYKDSKTISLTLLLENYKDYFDVRFTQRDIVAKVTNMMNTAMPIESRFDYYQETLFRRYIKNEILKAIRDFQAQKINTDELLETIHKFENMSIKLEDHKLSEEEIFNLINSENKNINFRFNVLSKYANIQEHDLVVIAARPGMGKTGFILNLLEDISDDYNCILFNMEMSEKQVYQRLVGINTSITMAHQVDPKTEYQKEKLKEGCKRIADKKIKVMNTSQTVNSIRRKIINETKNGHVIAFIDYVGLIIGQKGQTPYERVTAIVKELRQITLDYDCTIFLVSQMNRNSESNSNREPVPKISDLKESGELEQSATTVLMLYDEYHKVNKSKTEIEIKVVIGKNRNGRVAMIPLTYNKENQKFDNPKKRENEPNSWRKE